MNVWCMYDIVLNLTSLFKCTQQCVGLVDQSVGTQKHILRPVIQGDNKETTQ